MTVHSGVSAQGAIDFLKGCPDFSAGTRPSLRALAASLRPREVRAGSLIYWEGDESGPAYGVAGGRIALAATMTNGLSQFVSLVHPGNLFGHVSVITGCRRPTSATAMVDSRLWEIPTEALRQALTRDGGLALGMAASTLSALARRDADSARRGAQSARQRVAWILLEFDTPDAPIALSHAEIGFMVGLARESVSRALAALKRQGAVATRRGNVVLIDKRKLQQLAGFNEVLPAPVHIFERDALPA